MKKQTIAYYTICLNEIAIYNWAIDYWKLFADHVYVYDNGSTDGILEKFAEHPDWITVIHYETEGTDNKKMSEIKTNCFYHAKEHGYDWAFIGDFDEFLYSTDWEFSLNYAVENNIGVIENKNYQLMSLEFPKYNPEILLHKDPEVRGFRDTGPGGKICCLNTHLIDSINYGIGCHTLNYTGIGIKRALDNVYMFHAKQIGQDYSINRNIYLGKILGKNDLSHRFGSHYLQSQENMKSGFFDNWNKTNNDINSL